jgi:D-alanyl-D-alanine carboxypeptidase
MGGARRASDTASKRRVRMSAHATDVARDGRSARAELRSSLESSRNVALRGLARGLVYAKTGTVGADLITDRLLLQTKALAGYFKAADGSWRIFDIVVNNGGGGLDVQPVLDANEDLGEIAALLWRDQHNS